ncbi:unnamed protein product [Penicillium egyptiacum]|uniref:Carrier domain-containing protein n=1 Tax=Penicillium egyptiacum TaxID=1303716 RepID=A0A9W4KK87_9EURO|nr:unnamed protein product [Penicillium egyptiacum]
MGSPSIGRGVGCCTWVVDPTEIERLLPVRCIDELVIERPLVGQGYLGEPGKTAESFVQDPARLLRGGPGCPGRQGRLHRTGDLVRYNADGTLVFVGREYFQVKIRGQRVELREVGAPCTAESCGRHRVGRRGRGDYTTRQHGPNRVQEAIQQATQGLQERLGKQLPGYMVPSACIPVDEIPTTVTGKMDRRRLREIGGAMRREQLAALQPARGERRAATTATERRLQDLWASILGLEAGSTAADYNFLRIGGDSIGAMRLVEVARNHGLSFTVADVLSNPSLGALAGALSEIHTLR